MTGRYGHLRTKDQSATFHDPAKIVRKKQHKTTSPVYHLKTNSSSLATNVAEPPQPTMGSLFTKAGGVRDADERSSHAGEVL